MPSNNYDVEEVLNKLQSLNLIKMSRKLNDWYSIYCPFHSGGQEKRPSCGVSIQDIYRGGQYYPKGSFHCFTCGIFYSLPEAVTKILESHNISKSGFEWLKENIPDFDSDDAEFDYLIPQDMMESLNSKFAVDYLKSVTNQDEHQYVSDEELESYRFTVPYMYERGLTDEIIEKYDIGVDVNFKKTNWKKPVPCITFPVRDMNGNTLFVARRAIDKKAFYLPDDIEKPLYGIYELPKGCKSVDIVESVFNLTSCVKYGRPAIALFGTGTQKQRNELKKLGITEFRLALDPDDAGRKGIRSLKKSLSDIAIIWEYSGIPEGKDINDLTKEEFDNLELV